MSLLRKIPTILGAGGGSVPEWRKHLQPCEYLTCHGTEYIRLPFIYNKENIEIKAQFLESGNQYLIGSYGVSNRYFAIREWNGNINFYTGNLNAGSGKSYAQELFIITNENSATFFNGESWGTNGMNAGDRYMALFGYHYSGDSVTSLCKANIYYFYLGNTSQLISCYVIDEYTDNKANLCTAGVPGMVDTLTGVFYTNDGTGNFTHGADINI